MDATWVVKPQNKLISIKINTVVIIREGGSCDHGVHGRLAKFSFLTWTWFKKCSVLSVLCLCGFLLIVKK